MPRTLSPGREAFWQNLIARHATSSLTIADLCQQAGVSTASFYVWRRRLKSPGRAGRQPSLLPVQIVGDQRGGEISVEVAETLPHVPAIRICIPPGCDEASIKSVLGAVLSTRETGRTSC